MPTLKSIALNILNSSCLTLSGSIEMYYKFAVFKRSSILKAILS